MFKKPVKIKSNSQVKGSDRKNVKERLLKAFPNLTEADVENLLPKKEIIAVIKLTTAANDIVQVYTVQKRPIAFDVRGTLFPTIYLLWKFHDLVPVYTTHSQVLSYLSSGADLMLPGVITPPATSGLSKYGNLPEGTMACVNTTDNKAAIAVGVTAQSSADMLSSGGKELGASKESPSNEEVPKVPNNDPCDDANNEGNSEESKEESPVCTTEEMDDLLNHSFFVTIKYSKTLTLPILTSNFYKLQMMPVCPEGKSLDIKKSSFKKLKPFLDSLSKEGLITIKEAKKGVESITAINKDHPRFAEFYLEPSLRPRKDEEEGACAPLTSVTESYIITPNVLPIFAETGLNKGDTVQMTQIRQHVVEYVKKNNCQNDENKRLVKPKDALIKICKTENLITWEEVMEKVCEAMKSCYKVTSGNEELVNKGKVSPITLTVSQRSGNKKVTLVDNLELFGIRIADFAKECQHGVAASTSISKPLGKKCDQLLVQGNQVLFVHNLLTEKYKIPAKYIKGLENAPKKKK
ncbi:eukaryotic translation initiation factor 2D isoform X2 [Zophobas morio]|uniref:eukaryotic translation initiation factor 2D isoform X2 n=1 Tax=Zophobas morio TaxID=2755281 RepID=UPI0030833730